MPALQQIVGAGHIYRHSNFELLFEVQNESCFNSGAGALLERAIQSVAIVGMGPLWLGADMVGSRFSWGLFSCGAILEGLLWRLAC